MTRKRKLLPGTRIEHYGCEAKRLWKIGWRDEAVAERKGYITERRGTSYVYVRRPMKSIFSSIPH